MTAGGPTSANLALVSSILEAWGRGDFSSVDWAHPAIEFARVGGPSPGVWSGWAGAGEATRDWLAAWKDAAVDVEDCRELDDERVLALIRFTGHGRTSGLDLGRMAAPGAHLFHVRDGQVIRFVHYMDRQVAFAELGVAPEPGGAA